MTFDTIEHHLGKETAERINTTSVPVYSTWSDGVVYAVYTNLISHYGACHAFLYLESLRRENIFQASLTKMERQEIILSIEYSITFLAVFVDKLQIKNHACINA